MEQSFILPGNYILSFPVSLRTGFFKYELHYLLFNSQHMVMVHISNEKNREIVDAADNSMKEESTFSDRGGRMLDSISVYGRHLISIPLQQILSEHIGSFYVYHSDIIAISLTQNYANSYQYEKPWEIEIKTSIGNYSGTVDKSADIKSISSVLSGLLGNKFSRV